jgi:hypothetical protein
MFTHLAFLDLNLNRNLKPTEASKIKIRITITSPSLLPTLLGEPNRVRQSLRCFCKGKECCSKL